MNCNCIAEIDAKLKPLNLRLGCQAFIMPGFVTTLTLQTEWIDHSKATKGKKKDPTKINCTYCPFCGKMIETPGEGTCSEAAKSASSTDGKLSEPDGSTSVTG